MKEKDCFGFPRGYLEDPIDGSKLHSSLPFQRFCDLTARQRRLIANALKFYLNTGHFNVGESMDLVHLANSYNDYNYHLYD